MSSPHRIRMFGLRPDAAAGRGACACASCNACERVSVMPAARAIAELPPSSIERRLRPPPFVFLLISHALRRASNWISLLNATMCALTISISAELGANGRLPAARTRFGNSNPPLLRQLPRRAQILLYAQSDRPLHVASP